MSATPRLSLPLLIPGQAQKELFHNEALLALDTLVGGCVEEPPRNAPPSSPVEGSAYLVGASPTGVWTGQAQSIAAYSAAGWRYLAPVDGLRVLVRSDETAAEYRSGGWQAGIVVAHGVRIGGNLVLGNRASAIPSPTGGATIDAEARIAVSAMLAALRQHGLIET